MENGAPEEIRTPDPQIRSLVLYPAELRAPLTPRRIAEPRPRRNPAAVANLSCREFIQFPHQRFAHHARANARHAGLHDVGSAKSAGQHLLHRGLHQARIFLHAEGPAQQHREGQDLRTRIGDALAGDIRR